MGHRNAGPVENALRNPVLKRGVAFGVFSGNDLRHIDNDADFLLFGGLRELSGRFYDPFRNRVAEVGSCYTPPRAF